MPRNLLVPFSRPAPPLAAHSRRRRRSHLVGAESFAGVPRHRTPRDAAPTTCVTGVHRSTGASPPPSALSGRLRRPPSPPFGCPRCAAPAQRHASSEFTGAPELRCLPPLFPIVAANRRHHRSAAHVAPHLPDYLARAGARRSRRPTADELLARRRSPL